MLKDQLSGCTAELKKFIAIIRINEEKSCRTEMISGVVDEEWHTFILSTKGYAEFCDRAFGKYIHH